MKELRLIFKSETSIHPVWYDEEGKEQFDPNYVEWLENRQVDADLLAVEIVDALSETGRLSNNDLMKIEAETTIKQTILNHKKK